MGEIRAVDVRMKSVNEFKKHLNKYKGKRFIAPVIADSDDVRISFNSQRDIARCLVNYSYRETHYTEAMRNCQTFAGKFVCVYHKQVHTWPRFNSPLQPISLGFSVRKTQSLITR